MIWRHAQQGLTSWRYYYMTCILIFYIFIFNMIWMYHYMTLASSINFAYNICNWLDWEKEEWAIFSFYFNFNCKPTTIIYYFFWYPSNNLTTGAHIYYSCCPHINFEHLKQKCNLTFCCNRLPPIQSLMWSSVLPLSRLHVNIRIKIKPLLHHMKIKGKKEAIVF